MAKRTKHYESGKGKSKTKVWGGNWATPGEKISWQEASSIVGTANAAGKGMNTVFLQSGDKAFRFKNDPVGTRRYYGSDYNQQMKRAQASVSMVARNQFIKTWDDRNVYNNGTKLNIK